MTPQEKAYNQYLEDNITHYLVSEFLGRGQYRKTKFTSFNKAKCFYFTLKEDNPICQCALYGISEPKDKLYPINVLMENLDV